MTDRVVKVRVVKARVVKARATKARVVKARATKARVVRSAIDPSWFVYVVRCADDTLYTGIARDVAARIAQHDAGKGARYTRGRGPLALLAKMRCDGHGEALRIEARVKRFSKHEKLTLVRRIKRSARAARLTILEALRRGAS